MLWIKETEKVTNHDVKAVEYFIKDAFEKLDLSQYKEFIHFGLTSQDIIIQQFLFLQRRRSRKYTCLLITLTSKLKDLSVEWADIPMLARTHGQPVSRFW
jgi:adenylosuccinate lyase